MLVKIVERSGDRKLTANGNVSATWVAQVTCPGASPDDPSPCALMNAGCYAESGLSGIHTRKLNRPAAEQQESIASIRKEVAQQEADGIRTLSGKRKLRVHVVGDCATPEAAALVGAAMVEHEAKAGKLAWTYTHAWREIPLSAWQGARVMASCHTPTDVAEAQLRGYGVALTTPKHPTNRTYFLDSGQEVVPCPAQFNHGGKRVVTCESCTLCMNPQRLLKQRLVVGFHPDAGTQAKVLKLLNLTQAA